MEINRVSTKEREGTVKEIILNGSEKIWRQISRGGHTIYLLEMVLKALLKKWTWRRKKQNISEFEDMQDQEVEINSKKSEE